MFVLLGHLGRTCEEHCEDVRGGNKTQRPKCRQPAEADLPLLLLPRPFFVAVRSASPAAPLPHTLAVSTWEAITPAADFDQYRHTRHVLCVCRHHVVETDIVRAVEAYVFSLLIQLNAHYLRI